MSVSLRNILAASPCTERGRPTRLSADPKGERIAYASGKSIFLRSIDDPSFSKQYTSHIHQTTVASFSPSGYYVASGDVSGMIKVWDAMEASNTKGEFQVISGRINDIAWDGDSQRIIAVGDGRGRFAHCMMADSGNTLGEISGHSAAINAVSISKQRPIRSATVADDFSLVFSNGAPFRFANKFSHLHTGYVYGVEFSPDGNKLVSVGADRRIQLYDGKTGTPEVEIGKGEHKGSIFGLSWNKDSKRFVTASADQTIKLWDLEAGKTVQTWRIGSEEKTNFLDQQVGVLWPAGRSDGMIISLSLGGDLNYLVEGTQRPTRIVQGHGKNITAMGSSRTEKGLTFWTGSFDGKVCSWDTISGTGTVVGGDCHKNKVVAFQSNLERVYSVGWDDTLRVTDINNNVSLGKNFKLCAQPVGLATADDRIFAANATGVQVYRQDELVANQEVDGFFLSTITATKNIVALGSDQGPVYIYTVDENCKFSFQRKLTESIANITSLSFDSNGKSLAAGDSSGKIIVYDTESWKTKTDRWSAHTGRVNSIAWNAEGTHAVSGGLDTNVFVWSLKHPGNRIKAPNAHKGGVNGVSWLDDRYTIASTGEDAAIKIWCVLGLDKE